MRAPRSPSSAPLDIARTIQRRASSAASARAAQTAISTASEAVASTGSNDAVDSVGNCCRPPSWSRTVVRSSRAPATTPSLHPSTHEIRTHRRRGNGDAGGKSSRETSAVQSSPSSSYADKACRGLHAPSRTMCEHTRHAASTSPLRTNCRAVSSELVAAARTRSDHSRTRRDPSGDPLTRGFSRAKTPAAAPRSCRRT